MVCGIIITISQFTEEVSTFLLSYAAYDMRFSDCKDYSQEYVLKLTRLSEPAKLNTYVQTIALPTHDDCVNDGTICFIPGMKNVSTNSSDRFWATDTVMSYNGRLNLIPSS